MSLESIIQFEQEISSIKNPKKIRGILQNKYIELLGGKESQRPANIYYEPPEAIEKLAQIYERYHTKKNSFENIAKKLRDVVNTDAYKEARVILSLFESLKDRDFDKNPVTPEEKGYLGYGKNLGLLDKEKLKAIAHSSGDPELVKLADPLFNEWCTWDWGGNEYQQKRIGELVSNLKKVKKYPEGQEPKGFNSLSYLGDGIVILPKDYQGPRMVGKVSDKGAYQISSTDRDWEWNLGIIKTEYKPVK